MTLLGRVLNVASLIRMEASECTRTHLTQAKG